MVVAQLIERLLPSPEIHGSNGVIGKFDFISTFFRKEIEEGNGQISNKKTQ